jgi:hypothetical protein
MPYRDRLPGAILFASYIPSLEDEAGIVANQWSLKLLEVQVAISEFASVNEKLMFENVKTRLGKYGILVTAQPYLCD